MLVNTFATASVMSTCSEANGKLVSYIVRGRTRIRGQVLDALLRQRAAPEPV